MGLVRIVCYRKREIAEFQLANGKNYDELSNRSDWSNRCFDQSGQACIHDHHLGRTSLVIAELFCISLFPVKEKNITNFFFFKITFNLNVNHAKSCCFMIVRSSIVIKLPLRSSLYHSVSFFRNCDFNYPHRKKVQEKI